MPTYRVYEVQEEIFTRKWLYLVDADSEEEAIERAKDGESDPVEQGKIGEPDYATSGWSARSIDKPEDNAGWEVALVDLETNRLV